MKKIFPLMLAAGLFVACHPSQSKVSERTSDVDESESSYGENYTSRLNNGVYDDTENDDVSFYDDEYNSDDEDEQLSDVSLGSDYNSYQVRCSNRNITVSDMNGNSAHYTIDSNGNLSGYDSNGNYYHSHTDNLGNTTGFDSDGNCYRSHTDDFGNTTTYDSYGNSYYSHTDNFGNTSGYDSNGNTFNSHTDSFGNTTVYTY